MFIFRDNHQADASGRYALDVLRELGEPHQHEAAKVELAKVDALLAIAFTLGQLAQAVAVVAERLPERHR